MTDMTGMTPFNNNNYLGEDRHLSHLGHLSHPGHLIADVVKGRGGKLKAVKICSQTLENHVWFAFNHSFQPHAGQAVYYADELPALRQKSINQLRTIQAVKQVFPGCRILR